MSRSFLHRMLSWFFLSTIYFCFFWDPRGKSLLTLWILKNQQRISSSDYFHQEKRESHHQRGGVIESWPRFGKQTCSYFSRFGIFAHLVDCHASGIYMQHNLLSACLPPPQRRSHIKKIQMKTNLFWYCLYNDTVLWSHLCYFSYDAFILEPINIYF